MSQQTEVVTNHVPSDNASEVGRITLMIRTALAGLRVAVPVKVMAVTNSGGVSPIGYVDVQPLVSALDGSGNVWPHATVHNVPYMRIQGGANAVILDPVAGDIGIALVCDRDISTVKASKGVSAPGSARKNDLSDMVYLMTIIGAAPTQYIQFTSSGINLVTPGDFNVTSAHFKHNGVNVGSTHDHQVPGVQTGGSTVTSNGPQ